jgi:hypothetical protein
MIRPEMRHLRYFLEEPGRIEKTRLSPPPDTLPRKRTPDPNSMVSRPVSKVVRNIWNTNSSFDLLPRVNL